METKMEFPTCIICFNEVRKDRKCCIFEGCGHFICSECADQIEFCPNCKTKERAVVVPDFPEEPEDDDLRCEACSLPFGLDVSYPVYLPRLGDRICNMCFSKARVKGAKPVKFFALGMLAEEFRKFNHEKIHNCKHTTENKFYCVQDMVVFCKLCAYAVYSVHKNHKLLPESEFKSVAAAEIKKLVAHIEADKASGLLGYAAQLDKVIKEITQVVSKNSPLSADKAEVFFRKTPTINAIFNICSKVNSIYASLTDAKLAANQTDINLFSIYQKEKLAFIYSKAPGQAKGTKDGKGIIEIKNTIKKLNNVYGYAGINADDIYKYVEVLGSFKITPFAIPFNKKPIKLSIAALTPQSKKPVSTQGFIIPDSVFQSMGKPPQPVEELEYDLEGLSDISD